MLKINKETEERYAAVADGLVDMGYDVPSGVTIAANIIGVCESIANSKPADDIVHDYNIRCQGSSFNSIFRNKTGMNVTDVPKLMKNQEKIGKLIAAGYTSEQIENILAIMEG